MLASLRLLQICGFGACLVYQFLQYMRVLKHRTRLEHVVIERLAIFIRQEQRLPQTVQERLIFYIRSRVMYKDARFYISVSVDVTVPLASGYASVYKLSVVLEIYRKELFALL